MSMDRSLQQATFFPGLNIRLGSLHATRKIIEAQLEQARASAIDHLRREHELQGPKLHRDDREADQWELQQQVLHLVPKVLRGGFLVTLWAVLERTTQDIARVAMAHRGGTLGERDFRKHYFTAASKALDAAVGLPAFPDLRVKDELRRIQEVRHALVHHDGRQSEFPDPYKNMSAADLERVGLYVISDYDYSYIIPAEGYVEEATELVYHYLHETAERVFNALVPLASPGEVRDAG